MIDLAFFPLARGLKFILRAIFQNSVIMFGRNFEAVSKQDSFPSTNPAHEQLVTDQIILE